MIMNGNKTEKSVADHLLTADVDPLRSHLHIAVGETFFNFNFCCFQLFVS